MSDLSEMWNFICIALFISYSGNAGIRKYMANVMMHAMISEYIAITFDLFGLNWANLHLIIKIKPQATPSPRSSLKFASVFDWPTRRSARKASQVVYSRTGMQIKRISQRFQFLLRALRWNRRNEGIVNGANPIKKRLQYALKASIIII